MIYSGGTGANQDLKANRNLTGKKKRKKKLSYTTKNDALKSFPQEATKEQLERIREKLREDKKKERVKFLIATILAILLIALFSQIIDWRYFWDNFR